MSRHADAVVLVTGAARGQGRSHAVHFAQQGATVVGIDLDTGTGTGTATEADLASVPYRLPRAGELAETAEQVRHIGRPGLFRSVDVRHSDALRDLDREITERFGGVDILLANAGVISYARAWELTDAQWLDTLDVNLTGVWRTVRAVVPGMIDRARGGSIVLTSSIAGVRGTANSAAYTASKHGVVGLMRTLAQELGRYRIRVNCVLPTSVDTPMIDNAATHRLFRPDLADPARSDTVDAFRRMHLLDVPWVEPIDVSHAVSFLASEDARYITGSALPVDAGALSR